VIKDYQNRVVDANGTTLYKSHYALELLYQQLPLNKTWLEDSQTQKYNQFADIMSLKWPPLVTQLPAKTPDLKLFKHMQSQWQIPQNYLQLDIKSYVIQLCSSKDELDRVNMEFDTFEKMNWIPVLQTLKYIVDIMRENNIVWGVGRGSSVASYTLFLLGVHKINSIEFGLDFNEFAKISDK
jgi:DNA polymerase III alpha subunit